jgi:hypothetical protein
MEYYSILTKYLNIEVVLDFIVFMRLKVKVSKLNKKKKKKSSPMITKDGPSAF